MQMFSCQYFSRYSSVHFIPDPEGDLFFNNVSSDVLRTSFLNGIQGDGAFRVSDAHTLRAGLIVSGEETENDNSSIVLQLPRRRMWVGGRMHDQ